MISKIVILSRIWYHILLIIYVFILIGCKKDSLQPKASDSVYCPMVYRTCSPLLELFIYIDSKIINQNTCFIGHYYKNDTLNFYLPSIDGYDSSKIRSKYYRYNGLYAYYDTGEVKYQKYKVAFYIKKFSDTAFLPTQICFLKDSSTTKNICYATLNNFKLSFFTRDFVFYEASPCEEKLKCLFTDDFSLKCNGVLIKTKKILIP